MAGAGSIQAERKNPVHPNRPAASRMGINGAGFTPSPDVLTSAMTEADVRWLQQAVATAGERPLSELEEQGLIQAFAFTHELSWLLLKDFLADQGASGVSGSRDAVREPALQELKISMERRATQR